MIKIFLVSFTIFISNAMASEVKITSSDKSIQESIKVIENNKKYSFYTCSINQESKEECLSLLNIKYGFKKSTISRKMKMEIGKTSGATILNGFGSIAVVMVKGFLRNTILKTPQLIARLTGVSIIEASLLDALSPSEHLYSAVVLKIVMQKKDDEVNDIREFRDTLRQLLEEINE